MNERTNETKAALTKHSATRARDRNRTDQKLAAQPMVTLEHVRTREQRAAQVLFNIDLVFLGSIAHFQTLGRRVRQSNRSTV